MLSWVSKKKTPTETKTKRLSATFAPCSNLTYFFVLSQMEKMGTTFNKHIEKHRLWYYIFYKYCLDMKDQTDYTGIEYMITEKIASENVTWFPDNGEKDISGEIEQLV
jgi:hypothetical protein